MFNAEYSDRFLNRFQQSSEMHKEMLAILSAITELIRERNGTQSSTEFFLGLVSLFENLCKTNINSTNIYVTIQRWNM